MLDVRTPIGALFGAIGLLLAAYGLSTPAETYRISLGYNLNMGWGLGMVGFALVMFAWQRLSPLEADAPAEKARPMPAEAAVSEAEAPR